VSKLAELAVIGVGQTPYRRRYELSTSELVQQAVGQALTSAGVEHRDIDMVIGGFAPDGLAGEASPEKRFLPAAGAVGKWSMRINTGGTTGVAAAYAAMDLLEAGHGDLALVLGVERMAQANNVPAVFNSIFDPIYERDTSLSTLSMCAMRATRMMQRYGYTRELFAKIAAKNFRYASRNPYAHITKAYTEDEVLASRMLSWPIRQLDACPISEGVCAIVVARVSALGRRTAPVAHIRGRATFTDTYNQGDRLGRPEADLVEMLTLRKATDVAFGQAGLASADDADLIEIHAPFDSAEAMAYAPLRLCSVHEGPELVKSGYGGWDSSTMINPSGGPQAANPVGATALIRLAECAMQVMGTAGEHQVHGARLGVATGQGGSTQFSTCTVVSGN
jgi:acetyl-CoA C-acetyltransferase